MARRIFGIAALTFALVSCHTLLAGGIRPPVKATFQASKPDAMGKQTVTVTLQIEDGWHIYANPVGNEGYASNRVLFQATGAVVKVLYPPGEEKIGTAADGKKFTYNIHKGKVVIRAEVTRPSTPGPVELTLIYNACDANRCFPTNKDNKFKLE